MAVCAVFLLLTTVVMSSNDRSDAYTASGILEQIQTASQVRSADQEPAITAATSTVQIDIDSQEVALVVEGNSADYALLMGYNQNTNTDISVMVGSPWSADAAFIVCEAVGVQMAGTIWGQGSQLAATTGVIRGSQFQLASNQATSGSVWG